ncbi:MAG: hypothetical protein PHW75_03105 [Patescibacteria group bacterium]|nr:hypothetical protein [Patescibacteria group bacterium]
MTTVRQQGSPTQEERWIDSAERRLKAEREEYGRGHLYLTAVGTLLHWARQGK